MIGTSADPNSEARIEAWAECIISMMCAADMPVLTGLSIASTIVARLLKTFDQPGRDAMAQRTMTLIFESLARETPLAQMPPEGRA